MVQKKKLLMHLVISFLKKKIRKLILNNFEKELYTRKIYQILKF